MERIIKKYWRVVLVALFMTIWVFNKIKTHSEHHSSSRDSLRSERPAFMDKQKPDVDHEIEDVRSMLASSEYTKYRNSRFDFSFKYPDCFERGEEPLNGDGCGFSMKYGITFSVWGIYNVNDETIQEYYENDTDLAAATYHVQKGNWFVISGKTKDGKIFYKKVVLMKGDAEGGTYVTFYLLFPKKFNDVMADFIKYEAKNFNPKYEGGYKHRQQEEDELDDPLKNLQIEVQRQPAVKQNGLTRDQQIALMFLMLAASSEESGNGGDQQNECVCGTCGLSFSNSGDLRSHQNAAHDY